MRFNFFLSNWIPEFDAGISLLANGLFKGLLSAADTYQEDF
jgi:hypothetical protein